MNIGDRVNDHDHKERESVSTANRVMGNVMRIGIMWRESVSTVIQNSDTV